MEPYHHPLPALLTEVEWRVEQRLFPGAATRFAEFRSGLEKYLGTEQQSVVLPSLEPTTPNEYAVNALRTAHQTLRRIAAGAARAIDAQDAQEFISLASDFRDVFAAHATSHSRVCPAAIPPVTAGATTELPPKAESVQLGRSAAGR